MVRILISNDDGIYAEGIRALADALRPLARPVRLKTIAPDCISVEGTPTDCVHIAITGLLDVLPDMVLSGINAGGNLGDDVWYSGTVAAAMEGRFLGLPAIAFSLVGDEQKHFATAAQVAVTLFQYLLHHKLPASTILNVNIPDVPYSQLQGFEITRLGTRHCAEPTIKTMDPRGQPIYWIGLTGKEEDAGPGTDFHAIKRHKVSITPLRLDLTHYEAFDSLASWVGGLNK